MSLRRQNRPSRQPAAESAEGTVRIIGGQWKRTPLSVPAKIGLRPTPNRVRETVFNWLGQQLEGVHCLDLFAGTGALGIEAASRNAARSVLIEIDRTAASAIRATLDRLHSDRVELIQADAMAALRTLTMAAARFDLVFLDPPFGLGWLERVLPTVRSVLAERAQVYIENDTPVTVQMLANALDRPDSVSLHRAGKAGQVYYHLFTLS